MKSKKLTLLVAAIVVGLCFSTSKVQAETLSTRYNGIDRYETAAKVCQDGWKVESQYAVIVNGENFPDALAAAPLAKKFDAPILLTASNVLNPYTSVEINRLGVKNVFIIGGRGVISQSIEDSLKARGIKITRLGGADRYETAIQIAGKLGKSNEVAIINGNDFRDGMSIASIAASKGMPIIPVDGDYVPSSVKKYLEKYKKADQVYVIGGEDKVDSSVVEGFPNVKRIGSGDMYSGNVSIIEAFLNEVNTNTLYISSAKDFPDSLGASALAPRTLSPILFVDNPMSYNTEKFLKSHIVSNIKVLGGQGAVSYEAEQIAKTLPLGVSSTENITDTIWQNEKYSPRPTMVITSSDGNKKEVTVDWNLTKINTSKPGMYTFTGKIHGTDKTTFTTLVVKPLPYKVDDIEKSATSRENFNLPTTVEAQMTDGSKSQVPVTWDYGSQQKNKPGVYVFYGTIDKYSKKVKLTLTVTNTDPEIKKIKSISNLKYKVRNKSEFKLPDKVKAIMEDNSTQNVSVTWGPERPYGSNEGVYTYEGTVSGYNGKVKLMLIVTNENGVDPNDPNYPDPGTDPNNPDNPDADAKDLGELDAIMQGDLYPSTVIDPTTKKPIQVTWTRAINIDTTFVDSELIDDCRISKVTLEGTISGGGTNKKVKATVGIIPKIIGITNDDEESNRVVPVVISITSSGIYDMTTASGKLRALIKKPDGTFAKKKVKVLLWDPPYVDVGDSQNYYVRATINHYSTPIMVTLKVEQ